MHVEAAVCFRGIKIRKRVLSMYLYLSPVKYFIIGVIYAYVMYKWSLRYQVCNQYFMCTLNLHISTLQKRGKASEFLIYLFKKHLEILQRSMFKDLKNILASQCILIHNSCSNKSVGTYKKKKCGEPTLSTT